LQLWNRKPLAKELRCRCDENQLIFLDLRVTKKMRGGWKSRQCGIWRGTRVFWRDMQLPHRLRRGLWSRPAV